MKNENGSGGDNDDGGPGDDGMIVIVMMMVKMVVVVMMTVVIKDIQSNIYLLRFLSLMLLCCASLEFIHFVELKNTSLTNTFLTTVIKYLTEST